MKLLKESPDHYYLTAENNNGKFIDGEWRDSDAWCFCYYKDEFYIAKSCSHFYLLSINFKNAEDIDVILDEAYYKGRFWKNGKYLAFWENPSKSILPKIINDIYKDVRIKITDDWWIELDKDKDPVKVGNYLGHKRKEIDMSKRHLTSPLYKDKKDVNGFGSEKYQRISSSNGFNSVAQMNYLKNENKMLKLTKILKKLIQEQIRVAENPLRVELRKNGYSYLLQLDENDENLTVIKSKDSHRSKTKAVVLYDGDASDFAVNNKALLAYGQIDYKKALLNFLNNKN